MINLHIETIWWAFQVDEGREDKLAFIGPPAKRHLNDVSLALDTGLVALWFFRGSGPVLLRIPIFLWLFKGGGGPVLLPPPPPYTPHPLSGYAHEIRLHEGIHPTGFPCTPFSMNWLTYIFYLHNFVTFIRPEKLNSDIKSFMIRLLNTL